MVPAQSPPRPNQRTVSLTENVVPSEKAALARNTGVDAMRFVMASLVVLLHSLPGSTDPDYSTADTLTAMVCRGAVPFFFIASGYFLRPDKGTLLDGLIGPVKKFAPIYLFWLAVYFVVCQFTPQHKWTWSPRELLSGGAAFHLWFIPALTAGTIIVSTGVRLVGLRVTAIAVIGLASVAMVYNSYYEVLHPPGHATRGGFFIAPAFILMGYGMKLKNVASGMGPRFAIAAFAASFALLVAEEVLISKGAGASLRSHDFTLATFLYGACAFILARSLEGLGAASALSRLSAMTLGVYTSHLAFVWAIAPHVPASPAKVAVVWIASLALALLTTAALRATPILKRVV